MNFNLLIRILGILFKSIKIPWEYLFDFKVYLIWVFGQIDEVNNEWKNIYIDNFFFFIKSNWFLYFQGHSNNKRIGGFFIS